MPVTGPELASFDWTLDLAQATDAALVGGKAVNLARLIGAGFPVPDGFVVTTHAFRAAGARGGAARVGDDLAAQVASCYHRMGSPIVAVRSSATAEDLAHASMAGQYQTGLNVNGVDSLVQAIEACWASVSSPRTRAYLQQHGIEPDEVAMAVVVQRQVASDVAGVLFTVDARTGRPDRMLIEASWGLGEMVVSGETQPDSLSVERGSGEVVESRIAEKALRLAPGGASAEPVPEADRRRPCLGSADVDALRQMGLAIEEHFGGPQDIEWAISQGRLYALQSRAITTADGMLLTASLRRELACELKHRLDQGDGPWVLHNLAETLPQPTPLTRSMLGPFHSARGGFGELYRMAGYEPGGKAEECIVELFAGQVYMNLNRLPDLFEAGFAFRYDPERVKRDPQAGQARPTVAVGTLSERMRAARRLAGAAERMDTLIPKLRRDYTERAAAFREWCQAESAVLLGAIDTESLIQCWHDRRRRVLDEFAPMSLLPTFAVSHLADRLEALLAEHIWDESPQTLTFELMLGGPMNSTLMADAGLYEIAHGRLTVEAWLVENGHRCPNEFDLAVPRWRERPDDVRHMAQLLADGNDPEGRRQAATAQAKGRRRDILARLPARARAIFERLASDLLRLMPCREDGKHDLMRGYVLLRDLALEAARRLDLGDDVFLLTEQELHNALRNGYAPLALVRRRRDERAAAEHVNLPRFLDAAAADALARPAVIVEEDEPVGNAWRGCGIAAGSGGGPVVVLHRPEAPVELPAGYVLVCRSTDPSWTPLFVNASAVVIECGGSLSHGAIVARELSIPAVVLPDAIRLLKDGQHVHVNGSTGTVRLAGADETEAAPDPVSAPDPTDTHIDHARLPPVPGRGDRWARKVRNGSLLLWGGYLIALFSLPVAWLKEPSLSLLDRALWPVVAAAGRVGGVAIIGVALAVLALVLQRLLTDHRRLREVKRRSKALRAEAKALAAGPRKQTMLAAAGSAQTRVALAAFVPLAALLGPFVVTFLWLAERIDPSLTVAEPGETVQIVAAVEGDCLQPVTLDLPAGARLPGDIDGTQQAAPVRAALTELRAQWAVESELQSLPWEARAAAQNARQALLADLDAFLEGPMEPQRLAWSVTVPRKPGVYDFLIRSGQRYVAVEVSVGRSSPPQPTVVTGHPHSIIEARVIYPSRAASERIFWRGLAPLGIPWDFGWLGVYILAYIPAMFLAKAALRLP